MKRKYHFKISFKWVDFWIGLFVDVSANALYICLLPMLPVKIWFTEHEECPMCEAAMDKEAYLDADGWLLDWRCPNCDYYTEGEIEWPFGKEEKTGEELEHLGYKVI